MFIISLLNAYSTVKHSSVRSTVTIDRTGNRNLSCPMLTLFVPLVPLLLRLLCDEAASAYENQDKIAQ